MLTSKMRFCGLKECKITESESYAVLSLRQLDHKYRFIILQSLWVIEMDILAKSEVLARPYRCCRTDPHGHSPNQGNYISNICSVIQKLKCDKVENLH